MYKGPAGNAALRQKGEGGLTRGPYRRSGGKFQEERAINGEKNRMVVENWEGSSKTAGEERCL